jgi:hypothetical protein
MRDRSYSNGPFVAQQGGVLGVLAAEALLGLDLATGRELWRMPLEGGGGAGWVRAVGPWFCVSPAKGYGFQVGFVLLVDPATGRVAWRKDFPSAPSRETPAGGFLLAATERLALCTWATGGGAAVASLVDIQKGAQVWEYPFTHYAGSGLGYAAFAGRILDTHAVVLTAKAEGFAKTIFMHVIALGSGKGGMRTLEGGKFEEHEGYGGVALRAAGDGLLLSGQTGLFMYGGRTENEAGEDLKRAVERLAREPGDIALAMYAAEQCRSLGRWEEGLDLLNGALRRVKGEDEYGRLFRARRAYREQAAAHVKPLAVPRLREPPVIDGELGEWPAAVVRMEKASHFDHEPRARGLAAYARPADCRAAVRLGWDEQCLYVAADVEDDLFVTTQPRGQGRWAQMAPLQDMLRVGLAQSGAAGFTVLSAYQFAAASQAREPFEQFGVDDLAPAGDPAAMDAPLPDPAAPAQRKLLRPAAREQAQVIRALEKALPQVQVAVKPSKTGKGTCRVVYEIALPWASANVPPPDPAAGEGATRKGQALRLFLCVRDQDETPIVKWLGLGPDDLESDREHAYVPVVLE